MLINYFTIRSRLERTEDKNYYINSATKNQETKKSKFHSFKKVSNNDLFIFDEKILNENPLFADFVTEFDLFIHKYKKHIRVSEGRFGNFIGKGISVIEAVNNCMQRFDEKGIGLCREAIVRSLNVFGFNPSPRYTLKSCYSCQYMNLEKLSNHSIRASCKENNLDPTLQGVIYPTDEDNPFNEKRILNKIYCENYSGVDKN